MTTIPGSVTPHWLQLREAADALARSDRLVESVCKRLHDCESVEIHDLGSGSGSMGRWLAPRLPIPQRWVLHDRDPTLLEIAVAHPPRAGAHQVTVESVTGDLARLAPADLAGATLVTASALLDILTAEELALLVDLCTAAVCPALLTLSVTGEVGLRPEDPLDADLRTEFNDHQRRTVGGRSLLGPDAAWRAAELFGARAAHVEVARSDWRLDAGSSELVEEWLDGWVSAACEQRPDLRGSAEAYLHRRREQLAAGRLEVTVAHVDILATPRRVP